MIAIGRSQSDKVLMGISMTTDHVTQLDAAQALLQATTILGCSTEDIKIIRRFTYVVDKIS